MRSSERILEAVNRLSSRLPMDKITFADLARETGLHWTTIQRFFGSKEALKAFLARNHDEDEPLKADTRTKIMESARRVFARHGFNGASLDLVAHDAGMTKGAVYWHFASKNDLFLALCESSLNRLLSGLPKQAQEVVSSVNPIESFRRILEAEFKACEEDKGERPALFFEFVSGAREPRIRDKLADAFTTLLQGTTAMLEEMQRSRKIAVNANPQGLAIALHSLINGVVLMWLIAPNQVSFEQVSAEISRMLWQGIGADNART
ncbi:TetR/AcrR family transcriptional regulator [Cohnella sp. LGH]|uniref:TetR/AcrR family transcriptional regulator n=1 Tax=Cohnella sp. LGH TaxID=1619153 RepID=UPI001ADA6E31|nr:TetR/AcrR family transcriptional regulator [Cohnella sp. LGH]QTH45162.1 TetR/AcrR family transcriptional regulator [Cohnella sp. LGH]